MVQYREELINAATNMFEETESRKSQLLNKIQVHAINQVKDGYTSFRISRLKKEDEIFLAEWAKMTNAKVKVMRFRCFGNGKKYSIRQYMVNLKSSISIDYDLEGKTLIIV